MYNYVPETIYNLKLCTIYNYVPKKITIYNSVPETI